MEFHAVYVTSIKRKSDENLKNIWSNKSDTKESFSIQNISRKNFQIILFGERNLQTKLAVAKTLQILIRCMINSIEY